ncbi:16S rRNA (cytosine(1402)-N(4))-methyltransferase [Candidatus Kaiserbacteria bacterium RIFCSPLOWO2_12_FULL_53_8]|uniref:Ribosomal RNA small subunit methyltransferase H n=2 Tax=Candidatus Kaiseribacteriota TaxID=1752734 RepID=A0A1F6CTX0_9BACT|nr:MAG: 16S rRNA (cytosine(1402)-N(4))-methyltransferase [Candidatus Kaiserbacteria bacterium RIFCSPHIGHO2_01_FULL_53_29]OGG92288.1 MAG: 16S rRNA (cytosine(1402)-N(4))-methyltransferase [Candidatus Kaiserbacteria bacterium RIFCSPLOWO2_12_FULL_53_8]
MLGASRHRPVLLHEAIDSLNIQPDDAVVDATLGGAGHALAIVGKLGERGVFVGFDLDEDAIERSREALTGAGCRVHLVHANFRHLVNELQKIGVTKITKALFDLGWSSYQLDSGRGFSFLRDEPLTMTYTRSPALVTAAVIVNEWAEESIADIIFGFGEERYSRRIARAIVERREIRPFTTSLELADLIKASVPPGYRHGRIHPATRTFQALRIAVNDELGALNDGLQQALEMLAPDGRIAVITFHSIEDRAVKQLFAGWEKDGAGKRVNKKLIVPSIEEVAQNPRSRSAKLRVFEKIS